MRGKRKSPIKPKFVINNEIILNRRRIANEFNKYFVSLASTMNAEMVVLEPLPKFEFYLQNKVKSSIFLTDCTTKEIRKIISELENGKSSHIPIKVIKQSADLISPVLATHFNELMRSGCFPEQLKLGKITPIYKKDNAELLKNYRPVSTLPVFGKIFEKIIYSRLYSFLSSKGIIDKHQFGFRKGHSTNHALNYSINHISKELVNKKHVLGIFIDLSKAFDTIDHSIMFHKLNHYGIRGNALNLLKSYMSDRQQYTKVFNVDSDRASVQFGVPQGSVLGPLLFLLYINDICKSSNIGTFILFADDTNIFISGTNRQDAIRKANVVLSSVSAYMAANKLHINLLKCCYMHFKSKPTESENDDECIMINNSEIEEVTETKFLGVIIDSELTWSSHIKYLNKKLKCNTGMLNRIKSFIPKHLHKTLYHTLFESHLSYGINVWGNAAKHLSDSLFITQKHCMRIMFGDKEAYLEKFKTCVRARAPDEQKLGSEFYIKEHTKPLFNKHEIFTVVNLYHHRTILDVFKILKTRIPLSLYSNFTISKRKDTLLIMPRDTNCYTYHASSLWNSFRATLSVEDVQDFSTKFSHMKNCLKNFLFKRQKLGDQNEWSDENHKFR